MYDLFQVCLTEDGQVYLHKSSRKFSDLNGLVKYLRCDLLTVTPKYLISIVSPAFFNNQGWVVQDIFNMRYRYSVKNNCTIVCKRKRSGLRQLGIEVFVLL